MSDTLSITTPDPLFDPDKPVRINGFLFLPARRVLARARGRADPSNPGGTDVTSSAERANISSGDRSAAGAPVQLEEH